MTVPSLFKMENLVIVTTSFLIYFYLVIGVWWMAYLNLLVLESSINSSLEWPSDISVAVTRSYFCLYCLQKTELN